MTLKFSASMILTPPAAAGLAGMPRTCASEVTGTRGKVATVSSRPAAGAGAAGAAAGRTLGGAAAVTACASGCAATGAALGTLGGGLRRGAAGAAAAAAGRAGGATATGATWAGRAAAMASTLRAKSFSCCSCAAMTACCCRINSRSAVISSVARAGAAARVPATRARARLRPAA